MWRNSFTRGEPHNKSLDASGGGASRNLLDAAKGALIRAAASTQTLGDDKLIVKIPIAFFFLSAVVFTFGATPQPRQLKTVCPAPYYGLGNGDGVLDWRCFEMQKQLSLAAFRGQTTKIKQLLRRGANVNSYAGDYLPPLFGAAAEGRVTTVRLLLDNGAEMNHKYTLNGTPLFAAVDAHHTGVVALLISRGVDVNVRNGDDTCLKIARARGFNDIVTLLTNAGARE